MRFSSRISGIQKSVIRELYDKAPPDAINLGLGEPDLFPPEVIRAEAVRVIEQERNGYTPNAGLAELRRRVALSYGSEDPERVCITTGSQEALFLSLLALVEPGDEVLIPNPGFVAYPVVVRLAGGQPVPYRLAADAGFALHADEVARAVTPRTRGIILNSPSNPTGQCLSSSALREVASLATAHGLFILSDEIYRELYYGDRPPSLSEGSVEGLVISGLSKSMCMTGWRLGWACGEPETIRRMTVLHQYVTTCAPAVSQKAAVQAFTQEGESARAEIRQQLADRRRCMLEGLAALGLACLPPEGAFYAFADVGKFGTSLALAERLLAHGVITVPGSAFGTEGEGYLRLSFSVDEALIREGLRRIGEALRKT
ncbi:MAG: aminotransferase class I/II-fold pyridoxal phosphate-dependent enzyme [Acidobacteria bacterium]|nr:aminotransferase class I/II-fold pyridoxal phosphate-dependent enzyme [Acidobacteriota bacterium]